MGGRQRCYLDLVRRVDSDPQIYGSFQLSWFSEQILLVRKIVVNRNVIFILCVVVAITGLLLVGKRATKPPESANAAGAGNTQSPASLQNAGDPVKGGLAP